MIDKLEICNIISNTIIEEFKKLDKKNISEIYVTLHSRFFVVEGTTTIDTIINVSDIAQTRLNELYTEEELKYYPYNFIDLIEYDTKEIPVGNVNYKKKFHKYFTVSTNNQRIVTSERFYGLSLYTDKPYYILGEYIANHLFERNLCKDVSLRIEHHDIIDCNENTVSFLLNSDSLITNKDWAQSLVLDLFPFEHKKIIQHLELDDFNFEHWILNNADLPWMKKDKISEMVLV